MEDLRNLALKFSQFDVPRLDNAYMHTKYIFIQEKSSASKHTLPK